MRPRREDPALPGRLRGAAPAQALPLAALLLAAPAAAAPEELGAVDWGRSFAAGAKAAEASGRPLLVLFDEVPGCSTVKGFGRSVLAHPLIEEAIETLFEPVVVYNNHGGADREVLESFREPAWNNPVVRVMRPDRTPLAPRFAGPYEVAPFAANLISALKAAGQPAPEYLRLLAGSGSEQTASFSMYCFWSGEAALGAVDGVRSTQAGFIDGREAVEVTYDPSRVSDDGLAEVAQRARAAPISGALRASKKDTKYSLRRSPYRFVPMTEAQKSRVNAALARGDDPSRFLSPRQLSFLEADEDVLDAPDLMTAWRRAGGA